MSGYTLDSCQQEDIVQYKGEGTLRGKGIADVSSGIPSSERMTKG